MYINKINHRLQEENEYVKKKIKQGSHDACAAIFGKEGQSRSRDTAFGPRLYGHQAIRI